MLKSERVKENSRRKEVESLVGTLRDERYNLLVNLAKKITDFAAQQDEQKRTAEQVSFTFLFSPPGAYAGKGGSSAP